MLNSLIKFPRFYKQIFVVTLDSIILISLLFLSFDIRLGYLYWPQNNLLIVIFSAPLISVPIFYYFGLYHGVARYFGMHGIIEVFKAVSLYSIVWGMLGFMASIDGIPRSVILINWLLAFISIAGIRIIAKRLLGEKKASKNLKAKNVLIYGAGQTGRQLADALSQSKDYRLVSFIDDSDNLHRQFINGIKVSSFAEIKSLVDKHNVKDIFLAIPSLQRRQRTKIINTLSEYAANVKTLPSFMDLAKGQISISDFQKVKIEDLLGRNSISPNQSLLEVNIRNKIVMVSGAGGSIGSELCRQILSLGAKKIILFEQSEAALYKIDMELNCSEKVYPCLGSVCNQNRVEEICKKFGVQTIYHAAAYKHVPMVEFNNTEGILNNVHGTLSIADAAIKAKVETFVLISTDKAVRPTNTMGASKRCSEIILQSISNREDSKTRFMIVRFGNVLNSSGSVIPLFEQQIKDGGPVTVTDKNIVRYFMTISEAVELVIQAGAMGKGGDIFVLDMGEPIKIHDLAIKMINLSGHEVLDNNNPNGDIEITYSGLRPGEKLFEELLIGGNVFETDHELILRAEEDYIAWTELKPILVNLFDAARGFDHKKLRELLIKIVPQFEPQSQIVDILYNQKK